LEKEEQYIASFLSNPKFKRWVLENDAELDSYWEAHINKFPKQQEALEYARIILLDLIPDSGNWEKEGKERLLNHILDHMEGPGSRRHLPPSLINDSPKKFNYLPLAFGLIFLFLFGLFYLQIHKLSDHGPKPELETASWVHRNTKVGQKSKVHLADGSTVTLNAQSELKYQNHFGTSNRDIFLKGEAYFEVASDSLPFRVITDGLVTTALGTAFNIDHYHEGAPLIQLASGSVCVENQLEKLLLQPGEEAQLNEQNGLEKRKFNLEKAFLWKSGILNFDKVPLREVFIQLERWYGLEFQINGKLDQDAVVSGWFDNDYLDNVLETISYSVPFKYEVTNKAVYIQP
jgi:transmembrane sensor